MTPSETAHSPVVVVSAADEAFALGLAALGSSVVRHRPTGRPLVFYIFDSGLSADSRARLEASWAAENVAVHWIRFDTAVLERCGLAFHAGRPSACKLVLDRLMPSDVQRLLYLDADTLVLANLTPLWEIDLAGHTMAAVRDTMIHFVQDLFVPDEVNTSLLQPNFNAGVMLIDLERWRKQRVSDRAVGLAERHHRRMWSVDQQPLNWVLAGCWKPLPLVWNRMSHVLDIPSYRCTCVGREEFEEAAQHPRIAHFAGVSKPWHAHCRDDRTEDFVHEMQRTAWGPWKPPDRGTWSGLIEDFVREPHRRYRHVRRGLRLARRGGPRLPWYRSAVRVAVRFPWSPLTFGFSLVANRFFVVSGFSRTRKVRLKADTTYNSECTR